MRNKTQKLFCVLALLGASASTNAATDGSVTFIGRLVAETCAIDGDADLTVTLPTIAIQRLAAAAEEAGSTPFSIKVNQCPAGVTQVAAHFEAVANEGFNPETGNLLNSSPGIPAAGEVAAVAAATNVEVRLYSFGAAGSSTTNPNSVLKVGSTSSPVTVTNSAATMHFAGTYYATGATTAGPVRAKVQYVLAYP